MFLQCGKKHFGGFFFIALKYRVSKVAFAGASLSVPVDSESFSGSAMGCCGTVSVFCCLLFGSWSDVTVLCAESSSLVSNKDSSGCAMGCFGVVSVSCCLLFGSSSDGTVLCTESSSLVSNKDSATSCKNLRESARVCKSSSEQMLSKC